MSRERLDTQFVIFPAGPTDADDLARVHVQSWRETYKGPAAGRLPGADERGGARAALRPLPDEAGPDDVTLAGRRPLGAGGLRPGRAVAPAGGGEAEVATLYLVRSAQNRGLGARLLRDAARALAAKGATSL
jgi:GNAT superfamily N-acetyltransferase